MSDEPGREAVEHERLRSRRSVRFIVSVVTASVLVLIGLAAWITVVPYDVSVPLGGDQVDCGTESGAVESSHGAIGGGDAIDPVEAWTEGCEAALDEARSARRANAAIIGAVIVIAAWAVSTWPSRRLTGERLGPLPDSSRD